MDNRPYSIYVKHRPTRTAFLIDTGVFVPNSSRFEELVDEIIRHNYKLWGGRLNPIIFYSGESLNAENLKGLELVDVDCIRAFSPSAAQRRGERTQCELTTFNSGPGGARLVRPADCARTAG
jgi:hypothetical protein